MITSSWISPGGTRWICEWTYDGRTSAGQVTAPFPQGHVLGTARGRFSVYVVSPHSMPLTVDLPRHDFLTAPSDFTVTASTPTEMTLTSGHMTALMPGVVLEDGPLSVRNNELTYDYDPVSLAAGVPILDVERNGQPMAADVVTVEFVWRRERIVTGSQAMRRG